MKAIETEYAGVLFRSRIEARWALFFDSLGVPWEYEPEAFRMSNGSGYLPDFRIAPATMGWTYAEVKPEGDAFDKARRASRGFEQSVILLPGSPSERHGAFLTHRPEGHECGDCGWCAGAGYCDDCADVEIFFFGGTGLGENSGANWRRGVALVKAHRFWNPRRPEAN